MKKTHRFLACTVAAILTFGMPAQAFEPALDPLPDLSSYPTQLLVDGQAVKQGAMPQYIEGTAQLPLRNILEQAGYKVDWNAQNQSAVFSKNDMETYRLSSSTGALTQNGAVLWTDSKITVAKGTTYVSADLFDHVEGITAAWDGATNTAIITTEAPRDNVYCYDLGEGTLTQGTREIPYRMQGVIGVPEGQNRPVVIFLHGAHPIQSAAENRYDLGFSYLVDQLADAGYLALSMNVGINYSFENGEPNGCQRTVQVVEQQSALLKQAIEGKNGSFPCDLKNKGDLNQVILVGHSRAGYDIFEVADQTELLGIQGLISAAPSLVSPLSGAPVDVPAGIIIPQYDGDVTSLDGGTLFDQLENTSQRSSGTDLIYLENGNHGGFSTALVRPDPFADRDTLPLVMEPEKQQAFFSAYVMDFVKTVLATGKPPLETVATLPEQYAGYPIMARVDVDGDVLYRAAVDSVENLQTTDAVVEAVNACSTLDHTAGSFRISGSFMQYDLTRIRWEKAGATVTIPVSADLRQASYLQMDLAQDSGDERNRQQDQSMSVTLRDAKGRETSMKIAAGTPALTWQEGTVESIPVTGEDSFLQYSTFTPLGSVRLNPEDFNGVDLGQITQIVLTFDQPSGSIMLREVQSME